MEFNLDNSLEHFGEAVKALDSDLIEEIQEICNKYNLYFFSGNGTAFFSNKKKKGFHFDGFEKKRKTRFWKDIENIFYYIDEVNQYTKFKGMGIFLDPK